MSFFLKDRECENDCGAGKDTEDVPEPRPAEVFRRVPDHRHDRQQQKNRAEQRHAADAKHDAREDAYERERSEY